MGYPLPQDIKWICDGCKKQVNYSETVFPDPNKTECYHKQCKISKDLKDEIIHHFGRFDTSQ